MLMDTGVVAFITLFVVIDPIGVAPMFAGLAGQASPARRRRIAVRAVAVAGIVLLGFAFGGRPLLEALGIGLPAFRIAGGILLLLLAIEMVMVRHTGLSATTPDEEAEASHSADISVFPLAIPLIAGPGALTSVLILMGQAQHSLIAQATIIAVTVAVLLITLACLLAAGAIARVLGETGTNVVTRVSGILVAALAVQFVADGALEVVRAV